MLKRNQIMITALALMIAVAGYLNFAGTQAGQEQLASADVSDAEEEDMTALLDLSEEDIASDLEDSAAIDIESLDSDQEAAAVENYLEESMCGQRFGRRSGCGDGCGRRVGKRGASRFCGGGACRVRRGRG